MPLIQIQHSENLDDGKRIAALTAALHRAFIATAAAPVAAVRTFALPCRHCVVGDENPDNAFVHIILRMRQREEAQRRELAATVFAALSDFMEQEYRTRPLSLSLEVIEIDTLRRNNMHKAAQ